MSILDKLSSEEFRSLVSAVDTALQAKEQTTDGKPVCALIGRSCPRTSDPEASVFCPHWKDSIPEHEKDGSGRVMALSTYRGCQVPRLIPYLQSMTAEIDHTHVAANETRNAVFGLTASVQSHTVMIAEQEQQLRASLLPLLVKPVILQIEGKTDGGGETGEGEIEN